MANKAGAVGFVSHVACLTQVVTSWIGAISVQGSKKEQQPCYHQHPIDDPVEQSFGN